MELSEQHIKTHLKPKFVKSEAEQEKELPQKKGKQTANSKLPNKSKADLKVKEEIREIRERNNRSIDDRAMRKIYANKAYIFALYTLSFWAFIFFTYFLSPIDAKPLSESALGIFTTACTINILAAFISIIKGLFPSK